MGRDRSCNFRADRARNQMLSLAFGGGVKAEKASQQKKVEASDTHSLEGVAQGSWRFLTRSKLGFLWLVVSWKQGGQEEGREEVDMGQLIRNDQILIKSPSLWGNCCRHGVVLLVRQLLLKLSQSFLCWIWSANGLL